MHPYSTLPDRNFWSKAVSTNFDPVTVGTFPRPLIQRGDKVMTAGSCFAARLVPYLEQIGLEYVRTYRRPASFPNIPAENLSYDTFSAQYGNIYTVRHALQLLQRSLGKFAPEEDRWHEGGAVIDPFRPGLRYFARSDYEFDRLMECFLESVIAAFCSCDVLVLTFGLTEAWRSRLDGAVYPACPGTIAGTFDGSRHEFVNFTVQEVREDLNLFIRELREINPEVRIILTVSPVPMIATATNKHVLAATSYTKSALRVAADEAADANTNVYYFPFYEIITGPQASKTVFAEDFRSITTEGLDMVMSIFCDACEIDPQAAIPPTLPSPQWNFSLAPLLARVAALECEEAAQDQPA